MIINGVRADELCDDANLRGRAGASGTWWVASDAAIAREQFDCDHDGFRKLWAGLVAAGEEDGPVGERELLVLREWYATCVRFLDHPLASKRSEAGRKAAAILRRAAQARA